MAYPLPEVPSTHDFGATRRGHRGGRVRRNRRRHPAETAGLRRLRHPGARGRPRRHVVRQPLPRARGRRSHHDVLVLLRAEPELVTAVHPGTRDQAVRRRRRRQVRRPAAHPVQHQRRGRPLGRGRQRLAGRAGRRRDADRPLPAHRDGVPVAAEGARHPGHQQLRGQGHPHHRLGGRLRSHRASHRRHRHGRHRRAAHPRTGQDGRRPHRVPAHPDLGGAEDRPAVRRAGQAAVRASSR